MSNSGQAASAATLTSPEAAALLGLSIRSVDRLAKSGELPNAGRFGSGPKAPYMFDLDDVRRLAARRARGRDLDTEQTLDLGLDDLDGES